MLFKVVWTDNHARDYISDRLVVENLTKEQALAVCNELHSHCRSKEDDWYKVIPQDQEVFTYRY